jgi:hypothetical protein
MCLALLRSPYYLTPMSTAHDSTARGQKRKQSPEIDLIADSTPPYEPQWKRAGFRSAEEANIAFWNNLLKVPLGPRALKEFDPRNILVTSKLATRVDFQRNSTSLKGCSTQLKRFAKHGGPDLQDLREV